MTVYTARMARVKAAKVGDRIHLDGSPVPTHTITFREPRKVLGVRIREGGGTGLVYRLPEARITKVESAEGATT